MKRLLFSTFLFLALSPPARAEVSVSASLKKVPDYTARLEQEMTKVPEAETIGSYPAAVLKEFAFKSYSRWELVPADPSSGRPRVEMEVYELLDPPGAFGLYSLWDKTGHPSLKGRLNLPIEHRYSDGSLILWRSSYFLHLRQPEGEEDKAKLEQLIRNMMDAIPAVNALPVAIAHLPSDDLKQDSVEAYFGRNGLALNKEFPEPLVPLMGLEDHIEIGYGRYKPGDTPLFVIAYPTPALAEKYSVKIQDALAAYFGPGVYLKKSGPLIGLVVGSETDATRLLGRVNYRAKIKWIEDKPEDGRETRTFLGVVTRAILGTLAFLLITGGIGIVVGYFRYLFIRSHPDWGKKDEMIRLKLDQR
ncbi:MAG: DUF6599 family protein [Acidobacteriota bacterium]